MIAKVRESRRRVKLWLGTIVEDVEQHQGLQGEREDDAGCRNDCGGWCVKKRGRGRQRIKQHAPHALCSQCFSESVKVIMSCVYDLIRVFEQLTRCNTFFCAQLDLVPNQGHLSLVLVKMNDIMATIAAEAKA